MSDWTVQVLLVVLASLSGPGYACLLYAGDLERWPAAALARGLHIIPVDKVSDDSCCEARAGNIQLDVWAYLFDTDRDHTQPLQDRVLP